MRSLKLIATALTATLLFSTTAAFAQNTTAKANIITSQKTIASHSQSISTRSVWDLPDQNYDDNYVFSSHINFRNESMEHIITVQVYFPEQGIVSEGTLYPGEPIDDITTNFDFDSVMITMTDETGKTFFSDMVGTYTSLLIVDGRHHPKVL